MKQMKIPFIDPRKINSFTKTYLLECEKNSEYENYEIIQQGALPDTPIVDYSGNAIFALSTVHVCQSHKVEPYFKIRTRD